MKPNEDFTFPIRLVLPNKTFVPNYFTLEWHNTLSSQTVSGTGTEAVTRIKGEPE